MNDHMRSIFCLSVVPLRNVIRTPYLGSSLPSTKGEDQLHTPGRTYLVCTDMYRAGSKEGEKAGGTRLLCEFTVTRDLQF